MLKQVKAFVRNEIVTTVSFVLAIISMGFVHPDEEYLGYIHWSTLSTLLCLMLIMAGLKAVGLFDYLGRLILSFAQSARGIVFVLVGLCFCCAPAITNDVSLITFVPFAVFVLEFAGLKQYIIPTLTLQTIAAHMGSMLTPIGNPHNIYLYSLLQESKGMRNYEFILNMLPLFLIAGVLLIAFILVITRKNENALIVKHERQEELSDDAKKTIGIYAVLFAVSLLPVLGLIKWYIALPVVIMAVLIFDRENFRRPDYCLLLTFIFLFVFVGNMGRIEPVSNYLTSIVKGNELIVSVLASQIISNAPASILLSCFSNKYFILAVGTDLGGLGTLIASMANLISFKHYSKTEGANEAKYILRFSVINILFLIPMVITAALIL